MRARLAYKLVAWAVVATLAAFVVDLGLNRLGWANTPAAGVEAVITISLMVFLYLLARKLVMRPLKSVERMAERISSGDLDARVHEDSSAEMALLSGTLNSMAEKLAESYEQLRAHSVTLERTVEERTLDLARERNKLAAIFRGIPDGVVFLSGDGVIIEANPVMDRSFGLKLSGFIGGKVSDLPDAGLRDALSSGTDALCAEARELEEGGRTYKVGCTSLPGDAGGMSGYIISFYDVTEEKLLEKSKADFISLITHDLKSPLTSILGYSELILDTGAGVLGGQERDYVRSINESGRRLLDMVEQYLDLTKMEAGMLRLDLAPVRPDEIIREALSGLDVQAEEIKYRRGDSKDFSPIKMPGLKKYGNVTMKKGIFKGDNKFWDWFNEIKMNTIKRVPVTISLLDEAGNPTMVWTLQNAWPTKITGTDLKAEGNEVAVESIEIVHEGLTIANS